MTAPEQTMWHSFHDLHVSNRLQNKDVDEAPLSPTSLCNLMGRGRAVPFLGTLILPWPVRCACCWLGHQSWWWGNATWWSILEWLMMVEKYLPCWLLVSRKESQNWQVVSIHDRCESVRMYTYVCNVCAPESMHSSSHLFVWLVNLGGDLIRYPWFTVGFCVTHYYPTRYHHCYLWPCGYGYSEGKVFIGTVAPFLRCCRNAWREPARCFATRYRAKVGDGCCVPTWSCKETQK